MSLASIAIPDQLAFRSTIVHISDTHLGYNPSPTEPANWKTAVDWIGSSRIARKLTAALWTGDCAFQSDLSLDTAYSRTLDGLVPLCPTTGNHDYAATDGSTSGIAHRQPIAFDTVFDTATMPWCTPRVTGSMTGGSYMTGSVGEETWLFIGLEWAPRLETVQWADVILKIFAAAHPTGHAVLFTHALVYRDSTLYDWSAKGAAQPFNPHAYMDQEQVFDGMELWSLPFVNANGVSQPLGLIQGNSCIVMTLSGHVLPTGRGRLYTTRPDGTVCHHILFTTQSDTGAVLDDGTQPLSSKWMWLRLYEINTNNRTISATTYSPALNAFQRTSADQFTLTY